jgi:hypothetical protein
MGQSDRLGAAWLTELTAGRIGLTPELSILRAKDWRDWRSQMSLHFDMVDSTVSSFNGKQ